MLKTTLHLEVRLLHHIHKLSHRMYAIFVLVRSLYADSRLVFVQLTHAHTSIYFYIF